MDRGSEKLMITLIGAWGMRERGIDPGRGGQALWARGKDARSQRSCSNGAPIISASKNPPHPNTHGGDLQEHGWKEIRDLFVFF